MSDEKEIENKLLGLDGLSMSAAATPQSLRVGNMTEREMIERLMFRAKDCMDAQAQYFRSRQQTDLRASKRKETLLRHAIYALRKRGYTPSADTEAEQLKLSQNIQP